MRLVRWWGWPLLASAALLFGCQREPPPPPLAPPPPAAAVTPPVDLGAVIQQVHFAFREEGGAFHAGHPTHAVVAGRDGRVELTAYAPERGSKLALRTAEISRRGERAGGPPQARLEDDGSLVLERGPVAEHLANTRRGLHQSWLFPLAPEGRGDLVVRMAATGARFQGETASGLHFRDPGSPAGVRYGHATWIDDRGERTGVKARWSAGEIVLRVPAAVVDRSSFPAVLDPYISPEIGTDMPVDGDASGGQDHSRVSTNGSNYLVVWNDYRDPATGMDILGTRVSLTGALLDPRGFVVCNAPGDQKLPDVADDNNTQYFVVWQDGRNLATTGWDLYGAIVPSSGPAAPGSGIPVVTSPGDQTDPAIAFDGTTATNPAFFAAWPDTRAGVADLFGAHLEKDGGVREPGGFSVSNALNAQANPSVAHDGSEFVVAWQDFRAVTGVGSIYARRVSSAGTTLFPEVQVSQATSGAEDPSVAGGSGYALVAWTGGGDVFGQILNGGGAQGGNFAICDAGQFQYFPAAAFDGSRFLVVWEDGRIPGQPAIYGTTVSTGGAVGNLSGTSFAASGWWPHLATSSVNPLLVYTDFPPLSGGDIYASVLTGFQFGSPRLPLSRSANTQGNPVVGFDGTNYLVVWEDYRNAASSIDLWGVRLSAQGQVLDPGGIPIARAANEQQRPSVAGGNGAFAVAWEDYRNREPIYRTCSPQPCALCYYAGDIYGTIVNGDGGVLAPDGVVLTAANASQLSPAVSFDGRDFFFAWGDDRSSPGICFQISNGPSPSDLYALRMTPQGTQVGSPGGDLVAQDNRGTFDVRIATRGDHHILGWRYRFVPAGIASGGAVTVLAADGGQVVPPETILPLGPQGFTVAADPDRFWTAWQQGQLDGGVDLMVRPVDLTGDAGTAVLVAGTDGLETAPALTFDGRALVLGFHGAYDGGMQGIFVEWLDPSGAVLPPGPVPVNVTPGGASSVRAAGDGRGHALLTYQKYDTSLSILAPRVKSNLVQLGDRNGAPCTSGGTCFSGFCVDGVCCESDCNGGAAAGTCTACDPAAGSAGAAGLCRPRVQGTVCRPGPGCQDDARCDGTSTTCPANGHRAAGTVCRPAADACDVDDTCTGTSPDCPGDGKARDGTACGELMACTAGACAPVVPRSLYDSCAGCSAGGPTALAVPLAVLLYRLARRGARRRGRWLAMVLLVLLGGPLPAHAAEGARPEKGKAKLTKLAFLGITGTSGVAPEVAASFSEYLQSETIALNAYSVIGMGEIRQMLGLERQKQMLGCTEDSSCLAEMVGALDADRSIFGDVSRLGDTMVLNVSLMDLKHGKLLSRVGKRVPGSTVEPLLDVARPVLHELVRPDPALEGRQLAVEKRFGGLRVGVRADADVAGPAVAPGLSADVSTRQFGAAVTFLYGNGLGVRAEGRFYPLELLDRVRPYAGAGATVFIPQIGPVVGLRGAAGAEVRLGSFTVSADVAYERFLTDSPLLHQSSVLIGGGVGYLF